jgi:polyhydroxyalkanoate synthase subunit PhaC
MNLLAPIDAAANLWDMSPLGPGLSDRTRTPSSVVDSGPQRSVHRYRLPRAPSAQSPVLLVPPLAAPARCFDLRRGCSVAEHLISLGYPTYLVDYGPISFADRQLGLEHWVDDVIPNAIEAVARDAGSDCEVQVVGWCLGGIMSLLAVAADASLPASSIALIASPFDFTKVRGSAPIRQLAELTGGRVVTALYQALGGAPAPLVSLGFQLSALDKRITKPLTVARNLHDREMLAHIEAVDDYMAHMLAYPGRTFGQLYHRFFRVNDLADGRTALHDEKVVDVADVKAPVLVVAGSTDVLAPPDAVHHVVTLLTGSPDVRAFTFKGGHLGVLTGRGARDSTWRQLDKFLREYDRRRTTDAPAPASWLPRRATA